MLQNNRTSGNRSFLLDIVIIAALVAALGYVAYRVVAGVEYNWKWSIIPQYLLRFDEQAGQWRLGLLSQGLMITLRLSIIAAVLATVFGFFMGLFRTGANLFGRMIGGTYVGLVRNIPPLVLVFVFYFFLGDQILTAFGIEDFILSLSGPSLEIAIFLLGPADQIPAFISAVLTLALIEGAYMTEIFRAGIESIEMGQWEASAAQGMARYVQMRNVILPQAFRRILPPLAGQYISTIKDSAIVSIISIQELTFQGQELMSATYRAFEIWITVLVMYFCLTFICSLGVRKLENRLGRSNDNGAVRHG